MEVLFFIVAAVVIYLLITIKNSIGSISNSQEESIDELRREIRNLSSKFDKSANTLVSNPKQESQNPQPIIPAAKPVVSSIAPEKSLETKELPINLESLKREISVEKVDRPKPDRIADVIQNAPKQEIPRPGFFERNPDLEKFIGENLANKIGIGILVLGIGFFVKYAIDQNWINEIGRVFIGVLCGGLLLGVAHWLRKTFTAFSSVLVGGGIAVLYLTIGIAFHEYHIFSQTAAFIIMVGITGFAVLFSLAYNRIELAVLSLLGGFTSPFMVSTGEGNYIVLFTYILILNMGMLVLAYYKKWNLINIIAYLATIILFASWEATRFQSDNLSMIYGGLIFATAFYLVFFAMNMINNLKKRVAFEAIEITLLLSNTFLYYSAGMHLLNNALGHSFQGLFTALLAAFNFAFAFALYKNDRVDKKVVFLLIGLVLTFASLSAPVQLEGNYITLFWAAEAVLLLWLSQKSGIRLMKLTSVVISALMVISLILDWGQIYRYSETPALPIILNKGYITSLFSLASLTACFYFIQFEKDEKAEHIVAYKQAIIFGGLILLYISQFLELQYQLNVYFADFGTKNLIIGTYNMIFILALVLYSKRSSVTLATNQALTVFGLIGMVAYLFFYHSVSVQVRGDYLAGTISGVGFLFHYILLLTTMLVAFLSLTNIQKYVSFNEATKNIYSWLFVSFFVFIASAELDHIVVCIGYLGSPSTNDLLVQNHKIGFPILWGISSFILIAIGLKWKKKHLRIISLTLFLITLVKLFTVDIRGISEGGKIAAFISLGILLLTVSFMYQRLKRILLKDEVNPDQPTQ